jgi:hypothetical protein
MFISQGVLCLAKILLSWKEKETKTVRQPSIWGHIFYNLRIRDRHTTLFSSDVNVHLSFLQT